MLITFLSFNVTFILYSIFCFISENKFSKKKLFSFPLLLMTYKFVAAYMLFLSPSYAHWVLNIYVVNLTIKRVIFCCSFRVLFKIFWILFDNIKHSTLSKIKFFIFLNKNFRKISIWSLVINNKIITQLLIILNWKSFFFFLFLYYSRKVWLTLYIV